MAGKWVLFSTGLEPNALMDLISFGKFTERKTLKSSTYLIQFVSSDAEFRRFSHLSKL